MTEHLSLTTSVQLTPRHAGLAEGRDNVVDVLVRIQAPDAPVGHAAERSPQALALVIDRSGSMSGRPLEEAKRCAVYVVGMLRATDSVSLVQFDQSVQRLWPAVPLAQSSGLGAAISAIRSGGNTDLHGGWKDGAESLSDVPGDGLKRVILLSDGQANEGVTDPDAIAAQGGQWAARGITTSTYGLGNHFNEELMVALARAGGGNHYYGDTAEDLMEPFRRELELLNNLCLRELTLGASVPDGVEVEVLNALPRCEGGWRLPDLAWGAEAWAVLRVKVPVTSLPAQGAKLAALRVAVTGRSTDGEAVALERTGLALPVLSAAAFDALPEDELVARRVIELEAADALVRVRRAARDGDWDEADRLIGQSLARFEGHAWVSSILDAMRGLAHGRDRARMMKESMYSSMSLRSRLAAKDEDAAFSMREELSSRPSYLRRKPVQGKDGE